MKLNGVSFALHEKQKETKKTRRMRVKFLHLTKPPAEKAICFGSCLAIITIEVSQKFKAHTPHEKREGHKYMQ